MKVVFFFLLSWVFSFSVFASTLGEMGAAAAIAGELQKTGQANLAPLVDQVKEKVKQYEQTQQERLADIVSESGKKLASEQGMDSRAPQSIAEGKALEHLTDREIEERLQDEAIKPETNPVDYKAGIQVFYKRTCPAPQENCNRGAVLTNIKSVIFDYSHSRGSFAKPQEK